MKKYSIKYHNKNADTIDIFETVAFSLNEAVLKLRQKRFKFSIENIEVN